jgi:hypothetical protein
MMKMIGRVKKKKRERLNTQKNIPTTFWHFPYPPMLHAILTARGVRICIPSLFSPHFLQKKLQRAKREKQHAKRARDMEKPEFEDILGGQCRCT